MPNKTNVSPQPPVVEVTPQPSQSGAANRESKPKRRSPAQAIRLHCLDCMGGSSKLVRECIAIACPFHSLRLGPTKGVSRLRAIRAYCKECVAGELQEISKCTASPDSSGYECPIWLFRMGHDPRRRARASDNHGATGGFSLQDRRSPAEMTKESTDSTFAKKTDATCPVSMSNFDVCEEHLPNGMEAATAFLERVEGYNHHRPIDSST